MRMQTCSNGEMRMENSKVDGSKTLKGRFGNETCASEGDQRLYHYKTKVTENW